MSEGKGRFEDRPCRPNRGVRGKVVGRYFYCPRKRSVLLVRATRSGRGGLARASRAGLVRKLEHFASPSVSSHPARRKGVVCK